ncbi:MAG TPA: hypothetical protein VEY95_08985 [Azospirillaceae bacterium]|nr:hypothetical protein [Azospirillaceae bacterium]
MSSARSKFPVLVCAALLIAAAPLSAQTVGRGQSNSSCPPGNINPDCAGRPGGTPPAARQQGQPNQRVDERSPVGGGPATVVPRPMGNGNSAGAGAGGQGMGTGPGSGTGAGVGGAPTSMGGAGTTGGTTGAPGSANSSTGTGTSR